MESQENAWEPLPRDQERETVTILLSWSARFNIDGNLCAPCIRAIAAIACA